MERELHHPPEAVWAAPTATGTLLRLTHVFVDRGASPGYAAGWHLCLAALMAVLRGVPVPPVAGEAARARGWENYRHRYEALLLP
ncbi:MAG TPA: hypothetical protein VIL00_15575 [Pseudonocardiaceae bacterium]